MSNSVPPTFSITSKWAAAVPEGMVFASNSPKHPEQDGSWREMNCARKQFGLVFQCTK